MDENDKKEYVKRVEDLTFGYAKELDVLYQEVIDRLLYSKFGEKAKESNPPRHLHKNLQSGLKPVVPTRVTCPPNSVELYSTI